MTPRPFHLWLIGCSMAYSLNCLGDIVTIQLLDTNKKSFEGAVIEAIALHNTDNINSSDNIDSTGIIKSTDKAAAKNTQTQPDSGLSSAVMDQIDKQFAPHILVVQQGVQVAFPNSDSIKHHVYSFSSAKRFQLKLYKGYNAEPVIMDAAGIVSLGCNIHDWMAGFIYVAQSNHYGRTNAQGVVELNLSPGKYQLKAWHPRFQDNDINHSQSISIPDSQTVHWHLKEDLLPELNLEQDDWDEY